MKLRLLPGIIIAQDYICLSMLTATTSGVKITVKSQYEPALSSPLMDNYIFSYHIAIENLNDFTVQLLRRHWFIFDSCGTRREVEGPGVVGFQPLLLAGESYEYQSACDLFSVRGSMRGYYSMIQPDSKKMLRIEIPRFLLEVPFSLN